MIRTAVSLRFAARISGFRHVEAAMASPTASNAQTAAAALKKYGRRAAARAATAWLSSAPNGGRDGASAASDLDHFSVLGLPRRYDLSDDDVRARYRALMAKLHPDRHASESEDERTKTNERAAAVTWAYSVVSDPHGRAEHLLELRGDPLGETAGGDLVGAAMLMEVMEIREAVDGASSDEELKALLDENRIRVDEACTDLSAAFAENDYDKAKKLTARLQYWKRIEEKIVEKTSSVS